MENSEVTRAKWSEVIRPGRLVERGWTDEMISAFLGPTKLKLSESGKTRWEVYDLSLVLDIESSPAWMDAHNEAKAKKAIEDAVVSNAARIVAEAEMERLKQDDPDEYYARTLEPEIDEMYIEALDQCREAEHQDDDDDLYGFLCADCEAVFAEKRTALIEHWKTFDFPLPRDAASDPPPG